MTQDRPMRTEERAVADFLRSLGLKTRPLPEHKKRKMPDLFATDEALNYLVEVKLKLASEEAERVRAAELEAGKIHESSTRLVTSKGIYDIVKHGVEQLWSPAAPEADLRLFAFLAGGREPETQLERMFSTFYGKVTLFDHEKRENVDCLYYTFSSFFSFREELDGVLVLGPGSTILWVNSLSPRADLLASSQLARSLGEKHVLDPRTLEEEGAIYVAEPWTGPGDPGGEQLLAVQAKYDRHHQLSPATFHAVRWEARVGEHDESEAED